MDKILLGKTKNHYDEFPFIEGGSNRVAWWRDYLVDFLPDKDINDKLMLDAGSSVGEISRGLIDRGARLACLDISMQSLRRCQKINPEAEVIHGNVLTLPFPNDSFDHTISIGVLHHTPDCRHGFTEIVRVTSPGGTIVVFLYNYWSVYNLIYHVFKPIRGIVPLDKVPIQLVRLLQPFVRGHLKQTLNDKQLRNLLGDKLWTPQASFHSVSEVSKWGIEEGLVPIAVKKFFMGYANVIKFTKQGNSNPSIRRQVIFSCVECGHTPMEKNNNGYVCGKCSYEYPLSSGIIDSLLQKDPS